MISYWQNSYDIICASLLEHLQLIGLALLCSVPFAFLFVFIISNTKIFGKLIMFMLVIIYCVPSIALFSLLIPLFGLGKTTAVIGLTAYNQILLVRSITSAKAAISSDIDESAKGLGLSGSSRFFAIDFPLMLPYLISGLRIVTVSTAGIATIAALINAGGLGQILFDGMRMNSIPKIITAIILISGLSLILNAALEYFEKKAVSFATGSYSSMGI